MAEPVDIGPLSPEGEARRAAIRADLMSRVERTVRARRRRRRAVTGTVVLTLIVGAGWLTAGFVHRSTPSGGVGAPSGIGPGAVSQSPDPRGPVVIERSATRIDPADVAIGDDELLDLLASLGRPTGLARIHGRTILTSAVTDNAREAPHDEPLRDNSSS